MTKKKKQTLKFTYNYCNDPQDKRTDTYVGETKDGVFHGQGKYTRKEYEGKKHIGIFTNGKISIIGWIIFTPAEYIIKFFILISKSLLFFI